MARYIDADKLTDKLEELQFNAPVMTPVMKIYNVIELVEDQPTADVAEVKRGKWERIIRYGKPQGVKCSLCGKHIHFHENFCPRCGAKMDGQ